MSSTEHRWYEYSEKLMREPYFTFKSVLRLQQLTNKADSQRKSFSFYFHKADHTQHTHLAKSPQPHTRNHTSTALIYTSKMPGTKKETVNPLKHHQKQESAPTTFQFNTAAQPEITELILQRFDSTKTPKQSKAQRICRHYQDRNEKSPYPATYRCSRRKFHRNWRQELRFESEKPDSTGLRKRYSQP